ncbi:MAG: deoxyribonuclease V [Isosphaeraceae bacterium]
MAEPLHRWDLSPAAARKLQEELASRVDATKTLGPYELVAGADASYNRGDTWIIAAFVVTRLPDFQVVDRAGVRVPLDFPYVPGLLSFREAPGLLDAFEKLKVRPDLILCDGQGVAHPRRLGIASHVGLWLGIPTIGCAKSRLCGDFDGPGPDRGDWSPLTDGDEVIGSVVRTRSRVKPLFVSPGHLCDQAGAREAVLATSNRYRLPIPARLAHEYVNLLRRRESFLLGGEDVGGGGLGPGELVE